MISLVDARVPRNRDELAWRVALMKRHRSNIITKDDERVYASWEEVTALLNWEDDTPLADHCRYKSARAFDNSALSLINVLGLLAETFQKKQTSQVDASIYAVQSSTLFDQAEMSISK